MPDRIVAPSLLLLVLLLLTASPAAAQRAFHGTVTDAETGQPLPAANIVIDGTYQGTITNNEGQYTLAPSALPATLVFRFIGYETQRRTVTAGADARLDVALQPVSYLMDELVVTNEDPATRIMRQVIARKKAWRAALEAFEAEAYTRFTVANDTGIVFIVESLSDVFWDHDRGMKEVVTARRQTENVPFAEALPAAQFVTNFYDDDVEIGGYTFVGVTHPRALGTYRFRLIGMRQLDGRLVYDIAVQPRSELATAFTGTVTVLDGAFALLEVALRPGKVFRFPPPIQSYDVTFSHQFSDYGGDFWLPVDFRSETKLELAFSALLKFPPVHVRQVSRLTDYVVNAALPEAVFAQKDYLTVDSAAVAADTLLARAAAPVPLESAEATAYARIDSTQRMMAAFRPTGPLARFVSMELRSGDASASTADGQDGGGQGGGGLGVDVSPRLHFNRVEGTYAGLEAARNLGPVTVTLGGGWSERLPAARRWSGVGALGWEAGPLALSAEYAVGPATRYASRHHAELPASVVTLLGGADYYDYYWRRQTTVRVAYERGAIGVDAGVLHEAPRALAVQTGYDLLARSAVPRVNPAVAADALTAGTLRLTWGDASRSLGFTTRRFARVTLEHGRSGGAAYTRYGLDAEVGVPTFLRRRLLPPMLVVHLTAGATTGAAPLQRLGLVEGRLGPYTPFGVLRTLADRPYEGDRHAGVFWEHSFRTLPFELLGWDAPARRGYAVLLHGGHARTWYPADAPAAGLLHVPDGWHHEVGASLSGLFGLLRLDVTKRLDAPGWSVGVAAARVY